MLLRIFAVDIHQISIDLEPSSDKPLLRSENFKIHSLDSTLYGIHCILFDADTARLKTDGGFG